MTRGAAAASWVENARDRTWTTAPPPSEALAFHRSLDGYAPTRIVDLPTVAAELGVARVVAKDETQRLGLPAFKALGASWAVHRAVAGSAAERVVVTATDGNHGRAVARFARLLGHRSRIVVPDGVSRLAIEAIRDEGAEVDVLPVSYDGAVLRAAALAAELEGAVLVQDTAWPGYEEVPGWIVEGYGTLFAELDAQVGAPPGLVVVPTGVGSLLHAALAHHRGRAELLGTAVISAEPVAAACVAASVEAGRPVSVAVGTTAMAGLNCTTVSSLAWPVIRHGLDAAVTIADAEAITACHDLAGIGIPAGPCGGAALAAARRALLGPGASGRRTLLGIDASSTVVLVITEGADANPVPASAHIPVPSRVDRV